MTEREPLRIDPAWHAALGQMTGGLSPAALATAYVDWALHLAGSPDKMLELRKLALPHQPAPEISSDPRFAHPTWASFPYKALAQGFIATQNWWDAATTNMPGVDPKHAAIVNFAARQWLDMLSPANFAVTNPQVHERTREELGQNLIRGARYWLEDFNRLLSNCPRRPSAYRVGEDLATTPGDVILRNDLIELIRYRPTTDKLHPEPILIVPAWIMKYYILDLTAQRSLVAFLRDQGFEVFILSWKNPDDTDANLSMQDYIDLGIRAAITKIKAGGAERLHAVGYCLGGTLLAIAAAAMARDGDDTLRTISLLASQVDFSEPGELGLFINESQVAFLEDMMATRGYLKADQMAGAFQLLRSNDLVWSRVIRHYLLGERTHDNPLMAWNADATRMPAQMHSEYLRRLFLKNDLAKGRFKVDGSSVALTDIRCPIYCVGTETDHVSPWRSVYRLSLLTDTDVTFVLTNGGHNGGILSEPGHPGRYFRCGHKTEGDGHVTAEDWFDLQMPRAGSWWPHWGGWLKNLSGAPADRRSSLVNPLDIAPGRYVFG
ncbi:PHA/PHB synthase family protein [Litoreibacter roseus]|uniref:Poly-beta-hydroxybutyrate polymerase n=1 Tax=Litoreibacter roseus TaxID=2601869 RepID=A0A6N6JJZ9_9RHOB|nr:alpha/beta fold hydrolase [Litoreibacter roseus]GFE65512.1 poly-beta-hydroxybutyrate polymerase [Litoreibacter roseus]